MSARRIVSRDSQFKGTYSSSASIQEIYGAVNIGYMSRCGFSMDIVGDDVQYEANRQFVSEKFARRGRMCVPSPVNGDDGYQLKGVQSRRGIGIDRSCVIVDTTDRESIRDQVHGFEGNNLRVSMMEGPFVDEGVNCSMKGCRAPHLNRTIFDRLEGVQ